MPVYQTPQQAEVAFYEAFERADLEAMMAVWADDDDLLCIHPMGPRLRGREAIKESWQSIFSGGSEMRFRISDPQYTQDASVSVHCVFENISFGEGLGQHSLVIATNIYRLTDSGWRLCAHHASPGRASAVVTAASSSDVVH